MDREHREWFERLEKRIAAIEDKLMPKHLLDLDELDKVTVQVASVEGDDA